MRIAFDQHFELAGERVHVKHERIEPDEYIAFLARTNLGQQYPKENFSERISALVQNVQISLIARNSAGEVIGVCFGITDFAYWLFLTDLGVARDYEKRGVGTLLVEAAHKLAGGERSIVMLTNVNDDAIPFYERVGMKQSADVYAKWNIEWTSFDLEKDGVP